MTCMASRLPGVEGFSLTKGTYTQRLESVKVPVDVPRCSKGHTRHPTLHGRVFPQKAVCVGVYSSRMFCL